MAMEYSLDDNPVPVTFGTFIVDLTLSLTISFFTEVIQDTLQYFCPLHERVSSKNRSEGFRFQTFQS